MKEINRKGSNASLDVVDGGLKKYFHPLDLEAVTVFETLQDGRRFAVEKIKIGKIERNVFAETGAHIQGDLLKQNGIVKLHRTFYPEQRFTSVGIFDLGYLSWHFLL
jgi:hypothetical protein